MEWEYPEGELEGPSVEPLSTSQDEAAQRFLDQLAARAEIDRAVQRRPPPSRASDARQIEKHGPTEEPSWRLVSEEMGEVRRFDNFRAAKRELGTVSGTELHHVVEQSQASSSRSGFSVGRINTTDNLVRLPVEKHREISAFYSSKPFGFDTTVRDSLNGDSWEDQFSFGSRALDRVYEEDKHDD